MKNEVKNGFHFELMGSFEDCKGKAINSMNLHPSGKTLLIHCRNQVTLEMDTRYYSMNKQFYGFLNREWRLQSHYTPNGLCVVTPSEDSTMYYLLSMMDTYI